MRSLVYPELNIPISLKSLPLSDDYELSVNTASQHTDIATFASYDARCGLTRDQRFQMLTNTVISHPLTNSFQADQTSMVLDMPSAKLVSRLQLFTVQYPSRWSFLLAVYAVWCWP